MIDADAMFQAFQPHREDSIVIVTGTAGRHWADHTTDQSRDLALGGAMGHTTAAALGLALSQPDEKVVLFDNGEFCLGPRKADAQSTRVVEYDISSGTHAVWVREYDQPAGQGFADAAGAVTVLSDDRWLIAWGRPGGVTTSPELVSAVSEIDPSNGTSLLEMHMSKGNTLVWTYRVYREPESDIAIPLNLP